MDNKINLSEIEISVFEKKDIVQIAELEKVVFTTPWREADFHEAYINEHKQFIVARVNETVVGYCGIHNILGDGEISNVAVAPAYRGYGIGKKMFSYLLETGEQMGVEQYTLEVRVSNQAAISLYESFGFTTEGVRRNFYEKPTEDAYIMWKYSS